MADVITDWTDPDGKKLAHKLTRAHVEDMHQRLSVAINEAQARQGELQTQLAELSTHIGALGDARKRIEPLMHASQHLEAIEQALSKLPASTHAKPKHKT